MLMKAAGTSKVESEPFQILQWHSYKLQKHAKLQRIDKIQIKSPKKGT